MKKFFKHTSIHIWGDETQIESLFLQLAIHDPILNCVNLQRWVIKETNLWRPMPSVVLSAQTPSTFSFQAEGLPDFQPYPRCILHQLETSLCLSLGRPALELLVYWINPVTPTGLMACLNPAAPHHPRRSDRLLSFSQAVLVLSTRGSWCSQNGYGTSLRSWHQGWNPTPCSPPSHTGTLNSSSQASYRKAEDHQ